MTLAQVASTLLFADGGAALSLSGAEQPRRRWKVMHWPARTGAYLPARKRGRLRRGRRPQSR